jgi:hypothetical protein
MRVTPHSLADFWQVRTSAQTPSGCDFPRIVGGSSGKSLSKKSVRLRLQTGLIILMVDSVQLPREIVSP